MNFYAHVETSCLKLKPVHVNAVRFYYATYEIDILLYANAALVTVHGIMYVHAYDDNYTIQWTILYALYICFWSAFGLTSIHWILV